jgi:tripartite ATP-independent transporter DctM subunit
MVHEGYLVFLVVALFAGILSGIPAMLAIAGVPLVTALFAGVTGHFDLGFLNFYPARVWGVMTNSLLMAVPLFVLMGVLLERSGLAERMLAVLSRMLGGSPRGIALSVLAFSTLIAASTGIIGATVVMLVLISLPSMLEAGIKPRVASGLICASGTLGQIIPPSILLVLLGDQIGNAYLEAQQKVGNFAIMPVSVGDMFAGAMLPGLLLVALYAGYIALVLRPVKSAVKPLREPVPVTEVLFTFLPPILLILAVLGSILAGVATTTEAAGLGAVGALFLAGYTCDGGRAGQWTIGAAALAALGFVALRLLDGGAGQAVVGAALAAVLVGIGVIVAAGRLMRGGVLNSALVETIRISGMVFGIVVAASLLSLVFRGFGGDIAVEHLLNGMPGGTAGAVAFALLTVFLLGFMLEAVEIIYIVVPLLGPPILATDISPVWFGVLLAMNLQTSFLTPPFGFALFYFRSVAPPEVTTRDIYWGITPFVGLQILALGILIMIPELATWLPDLMFR